MEIPSTVLPLLLCSECSCYLSQQPVLVLADGRSVCGKCKTEEAARNFAYETLAQLMLFPCRNAGSGCRELLAWNAAATHEEKCEFGAEKIQIRSTDVDNNTVYMCCICSRGLVIEARYECLQGHKICPNCMSSNISTCVVCSAFVPFEIIYLCKYWSFGCRQKGQKDYIKRHETDCEKRGHYCPFYTEDCKWIGCPRMMLPHLNTHHADRIISQAEATRELQMEDDSWVMVVYDEIFRCFAWLGEHEVEWLAKYVGPQEKCAQFACEVRFKSNSTENPKGKPSLKMTNSCHGWNNVALEKCIRANLTDVKKFKNNGKIIYKFKIVKKS